MAWLENPRKQDLIKFILSSTAFIAIASVYIDRHYLHLLSEDPHEYEYYYRTFCQKKYEKQQPEEKRKPIIGPDGRELTAEEAIKALGISPEDMRSDAPPRRGYIKEIDNCVDTARLSNGSVKN
jgi:hypothetical protein